MLRWSPANFFFKRLHTKQTPKTDKQVCEEEKHKTNLTVGENKLLNKSAGTQKMKFYVIEIKTAAFFTID